MGDRELILEMTGISKAFSGVPALSGVSLCVRKGSVHALMGENGAGKSTLMKILLGSYTRDAGKVVFDGREVVYRNPRAALDDGIAMIHQELSTIQDLCVYENVFLGKELTIGKGLLKNDREMKRQTSQLLQSLHIDIDPGRKMRTLSVAQQQMCEIAKAISYNSKLIIMDEPTSAITDKEVEQLFSTIKRLKQDGISIIYISHKMDEIFEIADEVTVLRDGCFVGRHPIGEIDEDGLIRLMVGRNIDNIYPKGSHDIGDVYLKVEDLSRKGDFEPLSFEVRKGEIFGMAGLMGAGRTEIVETLFGLRPKTSGKITVNNRTVKINRPRDAIRAGFGLVTEDRRLTGCFLPLSIRMNTLSASIMDHMKGVFMDRRKMRSSTERMRDMLSIKMPSTETQIAKLSGGNQQKVLIGRWLLNEPDILIFDEPTRGIDVGSKSEIHRLMSELASRGKCIIMVSSEMPEIMGMCDRILVMCEGTMTGIIDRKDFTQERILRYATHKNAQEAAV